LNPAPDPESLERDAARYRTLSRLSCLGVLAALLVIGAGVALLLAGYWASDGFLEVSGIIVLGVGVVLGLAASAFNMATFGMSLSKRLQRGR